MEDLPKMRKNVFAKEWKGSGSGNNNCILMSALVYVSDKATQSTKGSSLQF